MATAMKSILILEWQTTLQSSIEYSFRHHDDFLAAFFEAVNQVKDEHDLRSQLKKVDILQPSDRGSFSSISF